MISYSHENLLLCLLFTVFAFVTSQTEKTFFTGVYVPPPQLIEGMPSSQIESPALRSSARALAQPPSQHEYMETCTFTRHHSADGDVEESPHNCVIGDSSQANLHSSDTSSTVVAHLQSEDVDATDTRREIHDTESQSTGEDDSRKEVTPDHIEAAEGEE